MAFAIWLLFRDPSVRAEDGAGDKIKAVVKGLQGAVLEERVVPFHQDAIGWFMGKKVPVAKKGGRK